MPCAFGEFLECDVDVVKHFDVIAKKADGLNEHRTMACRLQFKNGLLYGWPEPCSARHALALKGKLPIRAVKTGCAGNQLCGVFGLIFVGIAFENGAVRERYGR